MIVLFLLPFFIAIKLWLNFEKIENEDEKFADKYGSLYEDMKFEDRRTIFFNTYFMMRRAIFVAVVCFAIFHGQIWLQIHLSILLTLIQLIYLHTYWPFIDPFFNKMEMVNEYTSIILLYISFGFVSLWMDSVHFRNWLGVYFILTVCGNMSVHLYFMLKE